MAADHDHLNLTNGDASTNPSTNSAAATITGMTPVNRQLNITRQQTYSLTELVDSNLPTIARTRLSGEISGPDSSVSTDVFRSNGVLSL